MDFRASPFVRSLRARESEFLQVLLTRFSLKRRGEGSVLSISIGGDTPTISVREAKRDVKARIPDFQSNAKRLQKLLDDFLIGRKGERLEFPQLADRHAFPFRYGSGGALPVVHLGGREYYCLFHRDVEPIGWNIANGGTDTLAELLNPIETMHRELREELVIIDPKKRLRYVFSDDYGKPFDLPEFAVARQIWKEHFPQLDFPNFKEIELPVKWDSGPDELRIRTDLAKPKPIRDCFLNINAEDFGIEVDRIAHLNISDETILCDGEIADGHILDRVIGLFEVDEMDLRNTEFRPSIIFRSATRFAGAKLDREIKRSMSAVYTIRTEKEREAFARAEKRYDLCPVSRRIIQRYTKLSKAASPSVRKSAKRAEVFISFAYEDLPLATRVCEFIEEKMGKAVFFSKKNSDPAFLDAIFRALGTATCLVAVATRPDHLEENWPHFEWTSFILRMLESRKDGKGKLRIIPFIQGFAPKELPLQFHAFHAVEVEPQGLPAALEELGRFVDHCC